MDYWLEGRRQVDASGGLYFPGRLELYVPQFFQADSRWGDDELGPTPGKLAAEGCAVASAAMTLASYGVDVDPGRLNKFLTALRDGYTPEGWLYWEKPLNLTMASRRGCCRIMRTCQVTT